MASSGHERYDLSIEKDSLTRASKTWSLMAWIAVWVFWLCVTYHQHPTFSLALIVTSSLVVVYAVAAYFNHLVLIPRFWRVSHRWRYVGWMALTMVLLTGVALVVIRVSYFELWGPDSDPIGVYKHFLIDLFGMSVHLLAAAGIVTFFRRWAESQVKPYPPKVST